MPINDATLAFSAAQALTTSGTVASTNYIDLKAGGIKSTALVVAVNVNTAFASSGAPTMQAILQCDDNTSFSSAKQIGAGDSGILKAALVAGAKVAEFKIPSNCERYARVVYEIGVADYTAGKMDAYILLDTQTNRNKIATA